MPSDRPGAEAQTVTQDLPASRGTGSGLAWAAIACLLLGGSGGFRSFQEYRHETDRSYRESCPIELAKIPADLENWHLVDDGEKKLDDMTMRITGGSDHIFRTYVNKLTGVTLMVLVLFGPAEPVLPHTPEICYPSSGFASDETPIDRTIKYPASKDAEGRIGEGHAEFRSAAYHKSAGRGQIREAVYHSFRLDERWSPDIGKGRKFPRRNPGIFKVQVQRLIGGGETLREGDPIEQFLALLVADIERKVKASPAGVKHLAAK